MENYFRGRTITLPFDPWWTSWKPLKKSWIRRNRSFSNTISMKILKKCVMSGSWKSFFKSSLSRVTAASWWGNSFWWNRTFCWKPRPSQVDRFSMTKFEMWVLRRRIEWRSKACIEKLKKELSYSITLDYPRGRVGSMWVWKKRKKFRPP